MESSCRISNYLRCQNPRFYAKSRICRCASYPTNVGTARWLQRIAACEFSSQDTVARQSFQENDRMLPSEGLSPVAGGIIALGKFDALHIGHRELAIQASKAGIPYLLSFVGMAEVFGWEQRDPIVAKCDRKRVLSSWAPYCGNVVPIEFHLEFSRVRHLTPRQFVEKLSKELQVNGVVAGENYRFGYKASGDASELVRLCKEYGLAANIVTSVMDKNQSPPIERSNLRERGQVSSTRVRHALAVGDMRYVSELLGRQHRLVLAMNGEFVIAGNRISAPKSCMLNQPPMDGLYEDCTLLIDEASARPCRTTIDETHIHVELLNHADFLGCNSILDCRLIGIEFGYLGDLERVGGLTSSDNDKL